MSAVKELTAIIHLIKIQTTYSDEEINAKLIQHNYDEMKVIREFMGLPIEPVIKPVISVNQEIYRQIRHNLDGSMRKHREANPLDVEFASSNMSKDTKKIEAPIYSTL